MDIAKYVRRCTFDNVVIGFNDGGLFSKSYDLGLSIKDNPFLRGLIVSLIILRSNIFWDSKEQSTLSREFQTASEDTLIKFLIKQVSLSTNDLEKSILNKFVSFISNEKQGSKNKIPNYIKADINLDMLFPYLEKRYAGFMVDHGVYVKHILNFYFSDKTTTIYLDNHNPLTFPIVTFVDRTIYIDFISESCKGHIKYPVSTNNITSSKYLSGFAFMSSSSTKDMIDTICTLSLLMGTANHIAPFFETKGWSVSRLFRIDNTGYGSGCDFIRTLRQETDELEVYRKIVKTIIPDFDQFKINNDKLCDIIRKMNNNAEGKSNYDDAISELIFIDSYFSILFATLTGTTIRRRYDDVFMNLNLYSIGKKPRGFYDRFIGKINLSKEAEDDQDVERGTDNNQSSGSQDDFSMDDTNDTSSDDTMDDFEIDDFSSDSSSDSGSSGGTVESNPDPNIKVKEDELFSSDKEAVSVSTILHKIDLYKKLMALSEDTRLSRIYRLVVFCFVTKYIFKVSVETTEMLLTEVNEKIKR